MPLRLGYNKSRAGCLRCKQRRVKCDEKRPCAACSRHGIRCSLLDASPEPTASSRLPPAQKSKVTKSHENPEQPEESRPQRSRPLAPAASPIAGSSGVPSDPSCHTSPASTPDNFPYFAKFVTGQPVQSPNSWTTDLELMHHYSTAAYLSLPRGLELRNIWQIEVPRLALTYDFLMHQMLAMSAYHLAFLRPYRRGHYSILASQHQNDAVKGLRVILQQTSKENCHAVFVASSLLSISAFGTLSNPDGSSDVQPDIDDLLDVFLLIRGMSQILDAHQETISTGPLGKFLSLGKHESITPQLASITDRLKKLNIPDNADSSAQTLCQTEVSTLVRWIEHAGASSDVPELRVAMTWPIGLAEGYLNLLRNRHPAALIVLGYYCTVLNSAGAMFWFVKGWGESILKDASRSNQPGWSATTIPDGAAQRS